MTTSAPRSSASAELAELALGGVLRGRRLERWAVLSNPSLPVTVMTAFLDQAPLQEIHRTDGAFSDWFDNFEAFARNPSAPVEVLNRLMRSPLLDGGELEELGYESDPRNGILLDVLGNPNCPAWIMNWAAVEGTEAAPRLVAIANPNVTVEQVRAALFFQEWREWELRMLQQVGVMGVAVRNEAIPREFLRTLVPNLENPARMLLGSHLDGDAQQECVIAVLDVAHRRDQITWAARLLTDPDRLDTLLGEDAVVLAAVAGNKSASATVIAVLCQCEDSEVRRLAAAHPAATEEDRVMVALRG